MRPEILFPLFRDLTSLPGVGAKTVTYLQKLANGNRIKDLLYHKPIAVVDRRNMPAIMQMQDGEIVTSLVKIEQHLSPAKPKDKSSPFKVRCYNSSGFLTLTFFHAYPDAIAKMLPIGSVKAVSGKVERYGGEVQIVHPDYIVAESEIKSIQKLEAQYPLTAGVSQKFLNKTINNSIKAIPILPEWLDSEFIKKHGFYTWHESIKRMHLPESENDLDADNPIIRRLAYDELLANQLSLKIAKHFLNTPKGVATKGNGILRKKLLSLLPFELTEGQKNVIREINADQESDKRMVRLLQGDVGSGKTIVSLMAVLNAVEAGMQGAIMAPTEILAGQHYKFIAEISEQLGLKTALLSGALKGKKRDEVLEQIKNGEINIIIGTHAMFQNDVSFNNLGIAVIDEQHRFGVKQRMQLAEKGENVDILLMSATPIPRTLVMTMYGDMDCSNLNEKPAGRKEIDTRVMPLSKTDDVIDAIGRTIEKGNKVYWICPLVEESEKIDLAAAEDRYAELKRIFGDKVGLVHGKMKADERAKTMLDFRDGHISILVATTVIEVGVDVKDATVIIIEHAERFGLAQLHQLRGRVGRNDKASSCILLYQRLSNIAKERLKAMRESNDGFFLAEEDLRLRGGGEILGTKQSGWPEYKIADMTAHSDLLKIAANDAKLIMANDPSLKSQRGLNLRNLLYLFEYDEQIKFIGG